MPGVVPGGPQALSHSRDLSVYKNPFRHARYTASRIDQGVDYSGSGPIYAIGRGVVEEARGNDPGWLGGYVRYRLTDGPFAGQRIYVAEGISPAVHAGQHVGPNIVVAHMHGGIETGFSSGSELTLARTHGQAATGGDPGAHSSAFGVLFNNLIKHLGGKGGQLHGPVKGKVPGGFGQIPAGTSSAGSGFSGDPALGLQGGLSITPTPLPGFSWLGDAFHSVTGVGKTIGDTATAIAGISHDMETAIHFLSVLFQPAFWLRVAAFLGGIVLAGLGLYMLSKSLDINVPSPSGKSGGGGGASGIFGKAKGAIPKAVPA